AAPEPAPEGVPVVGAEAREEDQLVRAGQHVDGVELHLRDPVEHPPEVPAVDPPPRPRVDQSWATMAVRRASRRLSSTVARDPAGSSLVAAVAVVTAGTLPAGRDRSETVARDRSWPAWLRRRGRPGQRNSRPSKSPLLRHASMYWKNATGPAG